MLVKDANERPARKFHISSIQRRLKNSITTPKQQYSCLSKQQYSCLSKQICLHYINRGYKLYYHSLEFSLPS